MTGFLGGWAAELLPAIHAAATWYMAGLIVFVQVEHYPAFARVGAEAFPAFHAQHMRRTTWAVAPGMLVELVAALALALAPPAGVPPVAAWIGLGLLAAIWLSTAAVQVPLHRRLERGYDAGVVRRLVRTNVLRTALWLARGVLAAAFLLAS